MAAACISLTAGVALPLIEIFSTMLPSELMVVRGAVTIVLIGLLLRRHIGPPSGPIITFSIIFSLATLALYAGIRAWGPGPTLIILTTTPVVNIGAKLMRGERVDKRVYTCLAGLLIGVGIALNPWQATFNSEGLLLSLAATILSGVGYEVLAGQKCINPYNKGFWLAAVTVIIGSIATLASGQIPFAEESWSLPYALALVGFGVTGGFAYYMANIVAFEKLPTEVASALAMAETPAVIVGSWLILDEAMTPIQWGGVAITLLATGFLMVTEADH
jgi:drug/metabolite transporter (DMT)-like permease